MQKCFYIGCAACLHKSDKKYICFENYAKMGDYLHILETEFRSRKNSLIAQGQKAYMRDQFEYYGLKTEKRREIQRHFLSKEFLPEKPRGHAMIKTVWRKPQREFQLFAQELAYKYAKQIDKNDIALYEFMVIHKSWWDTVDFIAVHLMGSYFKKYPEAREVYVKKWLKSGNIWLQRSALLFQLKYKKELDTKMMGATIRFLLGSKEFFINKAIGWILREYSKTNSQWVKLFAGQTKLHPLSKREALRLLR